MLAVQAALKACAGVPSLLVFDPGQYDFYEVKPLSQNRKESR